MRIRSVRSNQATSLKIAGGLHRFALKMLAFGKDPLEGIEVDLPVARIINLIKGKIKIHDFCGRN